ncbi:MAG: hypothetical protein F7C35_03120 [Desulfurococcales archaeon]|nr:hypothetical protein [Desulfurococcales archaeon]
MSKKRRGRAAKPVYKCEEPPCIHVVIDTHKKRFKVFIEDLYDDSIIVTPISAETLMKACEKLREALEGGFREASTTDEVDDLARKYLNVSPIEEED